MKHMTPMLTGGAGEADTNAPESERMEFDIELVSGTYRLLRLLLTAIEHAGDAGLLLTNDAPLVAVARQLVSGSPAERQSSRTALMALRDLVWRVDSARGLLEQRCPDSERSELQALLATDDIHIFLRQEVWPGKHTP